MANNNSPLSPEWLEEIRRRSAEYDAEGGPLASWDEIRADARKRAGLTESIDDLSAQGDSPSG
jgi:hypothetical protein